LHDPGTRTAYVGNGVSAVSEQQIKTPFLLGNGEGGGRDQRCDRDKIWTEVRRLREELKSSGLRIEVFDVDDENFSVVFTTEPRIHMWVGPNLLITPNRVTQTERGVMRDFIIIELVE